MKSFFCPGPVRVAGAETGRGRSADFVFTPTPGFSAVKVDQASDAECLCLIREGRSDFAFCTSWVQVGRCWTVLSASARSSLTRFLACRSRRCSRFQTAPAYALRATEGRRRLYHDRCVASGAARVNSSLFAAAVGRLDIERCLVAPPRPSFGGGEDDDLALVPAPASGAG